MTDDCNLSDEDMMVMIMKINVTIRITIMITIIIIIIFTTCEIDDDCNLSENRGWGDVSVPHGGGSHYQEPEQVFRSVQAMLYPSVIESKGW